MVAPGKRLRTRRGGGRVVRGGDACVALAGGGTRALKGCPHPTLQVDRQGQPYYIRPPITRVFDTLHRIVYSRVDPGGQPGAGPRCSTPLPPLQANPILPRFSRPFFLTRHLCSTLENALF